MSHLTEDDLRDALHGASLPELAVDARTARRTGRRRVLIRRAAHAGVVAGVTAAVVALAAVIPGVSGDTGRDRPATHASPTPTAAPTPAATPSADPRTPRLPHAVATYARGRHSLDTGLTLDGNPIVVGPDHVGMDAVSVSLADPHPARGGALPEEDVIGSYLDHRSDGYGLRTTFVEGAHGRDGRYVAWALLPRGATAPVLSYGRYGHGPRVPRTAPAPWDPETLVAVTVVRSTQYDWPYEPVDGDVERMPVTRITYTGADGARHVIRNGSP